MKLSKVLGYLPRGNLLDDAAWRRRHAVVQTLLLLHVPGLAVFGWWQGFSLPVSGYVVVVPLLCYAAGAAIKRRRLASFFSTVGIVYCSSALVGLSRGSIEAHFHFFIIIGFIALYQDWVPFLWNVTFTVISHGLGSVWQGNLIFNHPAAQADPWLWSTIHGVAVLFACVGMVIFWRTSEDEQQKALALTKQLSEAEMARREFTSDLLVNLARRNQSLLYRQLDIINQLEESERDPDVLGWLFQLDHLATRVRRNAESLLVLSGEDPPRVWSKPVRLIEVVRAAIAETEDLSRVAFMVDERPAVLGQIVADLTHLLAELTENAVRYSPPETRVTIRSAPDPMSPGTCVVTVEDWGVGMRPEDLAAANDRLAHPQEVDLSTSRQLGLHVVGRLSARHGIRVTLAATQGAGLTAIVALPPEVFARPARHIAAGEGGRPAMVTASESARAFSPPMASASRVTAPRAIPAANDAFWSEPTVDVIDIRDQSPGVNGGWAPDPSDEPDEMVAELAESYRPQPYQPQPPAARTPPHGPTGYSPGGPSYQDRPEPVRPDVSPEPRVPHSPPGLVSGVVTPSGAMPPAASRQGDPVFETPNGAQPPAARGNDPERPVYRPASPPPMTEEVPIYELPTYKPPAYRSSSAPPVPPAAPTSATPTARTAPQAPAADDRTGASTSTPPAAKPTPQGAPRPEPVTGAQGGPGGSAAGKDGAAQPPARTTPVSPSATAASSPPPVPTAQTPPAPSPAGAPTPATPGGPTGGPRVPAPGPGGQPPVVEGVVGGPALARRTPQAHLAPELRRRITHATATVSAPDAARARDALSRYQASRQAALRDARKAAQERESP